MTVSACHVERSRDISAWVVQLWLSPTQLRYYGHRLRPEIDQFRRQVIHEKTARLGHGKHQVPFADWWKHRFFQARERALAGGIERADRFHRGADKFDPEGGRLVKRP